MLGLLVAAFVAESTTQVEELLATQAKLEEQIAILQQELLAKAAAENIERRLLPEPFGAANHTALKKIVEEHTTCLDFMWLLICGALVMFMQAGFAILEAGACKEGTAGLILTKNVMDVCIGTIVWYVWGYAFAYGAPEDPNEIIGHTNAVGYAMLTVDGDETITGTAHLRDWFFQWAFCATAATIVSGGVAERIRFHAYIIYSLVMTGIIYPVIVWWTWSGNGWLSKGDGDVGYSDFAGSGIVHLTGGMGALVGAAILRPRLGRFDYEPPDDKVDSPTKNAVEEVTEKNKRENWAPHNLAFVVIGTFILWFGWYGFNCGSTLAFSSVEIATQASLVAMNTTISASTGGLTLFIIRLFRTGFKYDLAGACNGILVGLVAVCAGVGDVYPWGALVLGILGGVAHEIASFTLEKLKVDDPLDAFAVHGAGGMIGLIMRPILDRKGPQGTMLAWNVAGLLTICAWSGGISAMVFLPMKLAGVLRISKKEEVEGEDQMAQKMYRKSTGKELTTV
jgi:Amt family ammonium transporter